MFVIQNKNTGEYYKAYTNYGFSVTKDITEATKFKELEEAESILQLQGVQKILEEPTIERIKK
jgi:hypothetical protein